ncbi:MAG: glycerate kinase [Mangrovibacterium sp.]
MNILIAPNSMKGSLSAFHAADLIGQAFLDTDPGFFNIRKVPVADGGDDTGQVLTNALGIRSYEVNVLDPLGRPVKARLGYAGNIAVIEMADASGMKLLQPDELNPLKTSSYGTGQLIMEAVRLGATTIYVGVGGSATVDGGTGMLEALGLQFFDSSGNQLHGNGENLSKIAVAKGELNLPDGIEIKVICDVENPLLGEEGAAAVFAPQKGATPQMVSLLENGLRNFADFTETRTGKPVTDIKGGGAAGGIAAGMTGWLNAEIVFGGNFILDLIAFDQHVGWADLVITGEGKIDSQTFWNKAPYAVACRARKQGKKVIGIAGSIEYSDQSLFDGVFSIINQPCDLKMAVKNAESLVYHAARELAGLIVAVRKI